MKISIFCISEIALGKKNIKDARLDQVDSITKAKKKTYIQIELVGEDSCLDADAIVVLKESRADLILRDLDFVETRLGRTEQEKEKALLNKLKSVLEKEEFISSCQFDEEEKKFLSVYGLVTNKPVIVIDRQALENIDLLLAMAVSQAGFISFFTTGEKETRAWLIKKGINAWEAAGQIHSDIQRGFIRAEIISLNDFLQCGGETAAKQQGKMRLEPKEYIMQDCDLANFRFNK